MSELDKRMKDMYDNCTSSGSISTTVDSDIIGSRDFEWNWVDCYGNKVNALEWWDNNKKGDDDMRYLYEVILVNPKNDTFSEVRIVAKSETSALIKAYDATQFKNKINKTLIGNLEGVDFDDLKTSCRVLFEWKKEYSKTAVE